jgi:uncharacterized protein
MFLHHTPGLLRRVVESPPVAPKVDSFAPGLRVQLLILQSTPFCNLDCRYCYLPDRDTTARMSLRVVEAAVRNVVRNGLLRDRLCIVWHSGEPLVAGIEFYRSAFDLISSIVADRCPVRHSIQTNATLINPAWCDLFADYRVRVGVSVDGPAGIHDRHRRTRDDRGTHVAVMRGVEHLRRAGIPFHAIAVATAASLDAAEEIFQFFLEHGFREVGFNIDEREGVNRRSTISRSQAHRFQALLARLEVLCAQSGGRVRIRELDGARSAILHGLEEILVDGQPLPRNAQALPLEIVSVDHAGNFSTFSPELLGQRNPAYGDFVFGNVLTDELTAVFDNPRFQAMYRAVRAGVERCAKGCEYFGLCGGGAPANKLYENGSFDSLETDYCRCTIQAPIRVALERMERQLSA